MEDELDGLWWSCKTIAIELICSDVYEIREAYKLQSRCVALWYVEEIVLAEQVGANV